MRSLDSQDSKNLSLNIGWLYPSLMSTYGDRGNVIILKNRCLWRGIAVSIKHIEPATTEKELIECDLIVGGGAQDRQQETVAEDLKNRKKDALFELFKNDVPGLFVCGSMQLLGHWYTSGDNKKIDGLGFFDLVTKSSGEISDRAIGDVLVKINDRALKLGEVKTTAFLVGFENHGGQTELGKNAQPLATVIRGSGNNGRDGTEGAISRNWLATYLHGPILSKNPHLADWLIKEALRVRYDRDLPLRELDDDIMRQAHQTIVRRLSR